jgi:uncharacterized protein (TIGR02453 family)
MKNVIDFLTRLRANNNKEWFEAHKAEYKAVKSEFEEFAVRLIDGIAGFDSSVRGLTVRDCTYRIYRDVRFSHDKTPYKTHNGIYVCPGGKKSGNAGYYFHVEPAGEGEAGGLCGHLLTAGLYMPEPDVLRSVREEICYNGEQFEANIRKAKGFRMGTENALKRVPTGFPADTHYAEWLKLKDVYLERGVDDNFMTSPDLLAHTVEAFSHTADFVRQLNRAADYAREAK